MHTFYCYNHMYIKTIPDCFLLSFLTSGTILWSLIIDTVCDPWSSFSVHMILLRITSIIFDSYVYKFCSQIYRYKDKEEAQENYVCFTVLISWTINHIQNNISSLTQAPMLFKSN